MTSLDPASIEWAEQPLPIQRAWSTELLQGDPEAANLFFDSKQDAFAAGYELASRIAEEENA